MNFSPAKMTALFIGIFVFAFALWCLYGFLAIRGIETPQYSVVSQNDAFEVRQYEDMILATFTAEGDLDQATQEGFTRVAGYIFGGNALQEQIAMTAPVMSEARGDATGYSVSFVLPSNLNMEDLPLPNDPKVQIQRVKGPLLAVLSFSGYVTEEKANAKKTAFAQLLTDEGVQSSGEMILAQYNPPFTPWFMRHNELWVKVLP